MCTNTITIGGTSDTKPDPFLMTWKTQFTHSQTALLPILLIQNMETYEKPSKNILMFSTTFAFFVKKRDASPFCS